MGHASKHIVDTLIEERAPRLRRHPLLWRAMRTAIYPLLRYNDAVMLADLVAEMEAADIFGHFQSSLDLNLDVLGLEHVPKTGRAIIVANHPTGIPDGFALFDALAPHRRDISFLANRDAIRVAPKLADMIIPVDWITERRDTATMRDMLKSLRAAFEAERLVIIFPAGRLAYPTLRGLQERPWMASTVNIARKFKAPIVPLHISGRNSWLYYFFFLASKELKDMTVFHEMMNKTRAHYRLMFGVPLAMEDLPADPEVAVRALRAYVSARLDPALRPGSEAAV